MVEAVDSPNQLIDIIPPAIPLVTENSDPWLTIILVAFAALLILVIWLVRRWYHSERLQSLRGLSRLRAALQAGELSPREVSYWLADFIKRRTRISYLSPEVTPSTVLANERPRWEQFMRRLHEARYAPSSGAEQNIVSLLAEAKYWLRRWP